MMNNILLIILNNNYINITYIIVYNIIYNIIIIIVIILIIINNFRSPQVDSI